MELCGYKDSYVMEIVVLVVMAIIAAIVVYAIVSSEIKSEKTYEESTDEVKRQPVNDVKRKGFFNGHEWVDLGLSMGDVYGTKDEHSNIRVFFAKTNLGAETETDFGYYFRWGELNGWKITEDVLTKDTCKHITRDGDEEEEFKGFSDWKLSGQPISEFTGNVFKEGVCAPYGDAATYHWGEGWETMDQFVFRALIWSDGSLIFHSTTPTLFIVGTTRLYRSWVKNHKNSGVSGLLIENKDLGTEIFLPATNYCNDNERPNDGLYNLYWSSDAAKVKNINKAWGFNFGDNSWGLGEEKRSLGAQIRPVVFCKED